MTLMKSEPYWRRQAWQSLIPAILAMAYHWLVGSSGPVRRYSSLSGCGRELGIDAGTAQEKQFPHTRQPRVFDEVVLNPEVFQKKFGGLAFVGENAAHFGGGDEDIFRFLVREELLDGGGIEQVQFAPGFAEQAGKALTFQLAPEWRCRPDRDGRRQKCAHSGS